MKSLTAGLVLLTISQFLLCSLAMANSNAAFDPRSQRLFASNLFSLVSDKKSLENVIYSPASIHSALAFIYLGAKGDTAKELRQVLNLEQEDKSTFAAKYGNFLKNELYSSTVDDGKPQLKMNTRLYVSDQIRILPHFNELAKNTFGAEAENVDFSKALTTVGKINKWVEDQTEKKIQNLLKSDSVDGHTTSVLVNTLYFKGSWLNPFGIESTSKHSFRFSPTEQAEVDTMYTNDRFGYAELHDLDAKVLQLPYNNSDISMLIILPNKINGLEELEKKLKGTDPNDISDKLVQRTVDVFLPKFRVEFDIDLKEAIEKLGCPSMFAANVDLTDIFDSPRPQRISEIKHKAFVSCDEGGSEAAASTFMQISLMSLNLNKKVFRADHPFVFMIRSKNVVYFHGHVAKF